MHIGARSATAEDLPEIAALAAAAVDELTPNRGGAVWSQTEARTPPFVPELRSEIDDPSSLVVVGTIDDTIVGYGAARPLACHDGTTIARITDLYVLPDARGVGVGEELMLTVERWATAVGHIGLDSLALPGDRETKNFFETFGLVARALVVHRPLSS